MKYEGDIALYLSGGQVLIEECGIFITQPTVKAIAQFGETKFLTIIQILTDPETLLAGVRQGNSGLEELSNFQILLEIIKADAEMNNMFNIFCELCFPDYDIEITNSIDFYLKENQERICCGKIHSRNFDKFSRTLKELFVFSSNDSKNPNYNPANEKARAIAEKIKRGRKKAHPEDKHLSLFGTYISILSIGIPMSVNILYDYTPFQLYDCFARY